METTNEEVELIRVVKCGTKIIARVTPEFTVNLDFNKFALGLNRHRGITADSHDYFERGFDNETKEAYVQIDTAHKSTKGFVDETIRNVSSTAVMGANLELIKFDVNGRIVSGPISKDTILKALDSNSWIPQHVIVEIVELLATNALVSAMSDEEKHLAFSKVVKAEIDSLTQFRKEFPIGGPNSIPTPDVVTEAPVDDTPEEVVE